MKHAFNVYKTHCPKCRAPCLKAPFHGPSQFALLDTPGSPHRCVRGNVTVGGMAERRRMTAEELAQYVAKNPPRRKR